MNFDPTVRPSDTLMPTANGYGPWVCIDCKRAVGAWHGRSCHVFRQRAALAERKPKPARYRYAGLGLLLALALAGCEGSVRERARAFESGYEAGKDAALIAQADPRTEADWPRLDLLDTMAGPDKGTWPPMSLSQPCSLTVTNATPRTLLLEQECVVTLARPGDSLTVALEGSVTIREEASYDYGVEGADSPCSPVPPIFWVSADDSLSADWPCGTDLRKRLPSFRVSINGKTYEKLWPAYKDARGSEALWPRWDDHTVSGWYDEHGRRIGAYGPEGAVSYEQNAEEPHE